MIKRINRIKRLGVFEDFKWNSNIIPDFKKHNIFYGWNYSGKTTISRIFRCFELLEKHPDYPNAEFELEDEKGQKYNERTLTLAPQIRVFNTDFILKNLKSFSQGDDGIEPIYLSIGEDNIELQKQLEKTKEDQLLLVEEKNKLINKATEIENNLGENLKNKARDITNILLLGRNYEKPQLKQDIEIVLGDHLKYLLSVADYNKYLVAYKNIDKKDDIVLNPFPNMNFSDIQNETKEIVERKITAQKIISELKNNEKLNRWVDEGRDLHKNKTNCSFCNNLLPKDLFIVLNKHFSTEYEVLKTDIQNLINAIENHKNEINAFKLPAKSELYKEFVIEFDKLQKEFFFSRDKYCKNLDIFVNYLNVKKANSFDKNIFKQLKDNSGELMKNYDDIKSIFEKHKNKNVNFEKEKDEVKDKLIKYFSAQFIQDHKYLETVNEIKDIHNKIDENKNKLDIAQSEIASVEKQLSESVKGADKVNDYIQQFFQNDSIKIEVTSDSKFVMNRNNEVAKNLSEGEKTAISLAYFVARLEGIDTKLNETIVFIDDPVSSLDSNHLFNIYSFIKSKLYESGQLFVSTHNLEFFNLMKDFLQEAKNDIGKPIYKEKTDLPCYLVQREWNTKKNQSIILDLPKELKYFKSEYVYLYSVMTEFSKQETGADFRLLYLLPNVVRRFLEGYLNLRYPNRKSWKDKLDNLVKQEVDRNIVFKFVNEYSHNQTTTRSLKFPEVAECKKVIDIVENSLKNNDKDHYDALCESCK